MRRKPRTFATHFLSVLIRNNTIIIQTLFCIILWHFDREMCVLEWEKKNFYIFFRNFCETLPIFSNFFVNYIWGKFIGGELWGVTCILAKFFEMHVNLMNFGLWDIWDYVHSDDFIKNTRKLRGQESRGVKIITCLLRTSFRIHVTRRNCRLRSSRGYVYAGEFLQNTRKHKEI